MTRFSKSSKTFGLLALLLISLGFFLGNKTTINYYDYTRVGSWKFNSNPDSVRWIRLIPNTQNRDDRNLKKIDSVYGINHFFLDYDLTSGFVHKFSKNFFKWSRPDQFVFKFYPSSYNPEKGLLKWVRKKDLLSSDTLGKNIGVFRQWKLSEIDLTNGKIKLNNCSFNGYCGCPQINQSSKSPFKKEFPLAASVKKKGIININKLTTLDILSGGSVIFIWKKEGTIFFCDQHGSLNDIFSKAIEIKEKYDVDPTITVGDAGPFCRKIKANSNNILETSKIKGISPGPNFGAGFGYMTK